MIKQQQKENQEEPNFPSFKDHKLGTIPGIELLISDKQKRIKEKQKQEKEERTVYEKDRKLE